MTFMDDYWAGEVDAIGIKGYIDEWPGWWKPGHDTLARYLGMTQDEYETWFNTGKLPERGAP